MKKSSIKTVIVAAITMAAMCVPVAANAQLGGLVNKAKKKAEQVVDKKKDEAMKEARLRTTPRCRPSIPSARPFPGP